MPDHAFDIFIITLVAVLFHGSDWKGSDMYDEIEKKLEEVGADLVFLPHTEGTSSTLLSEKLQNV